MNDNTVSLNDPVSTCTIHRRSTAQNGLEQLTVPWDDFDVLFGGDTAWKLGPEARELVAKARCRGKAAHLGRVNSQRRLQYAAAIGCDSSDGTFLAFGPDQNLPCCCGGSGRRSLTPTANPSPIRSRAR